MAPVLRWAENLSDRAGLAASQILLLLATLVLAVTFGETQRDDPRVKTVFLLQEKSQSALRLLTAGDHRNVEWAIVHAPLQPERHFDTKDGDPPAISVAALRPPEQAQIRQRRVPDLAAASVSLDSRGARAPPFLV